MHESPPLEGLSANRVGEIRCSDGYSAGACTPYRGSVTSNSMAASWSGDLPMLSRNGSQRGSS